jgi:general stress protein 26
MSETTDQRKFEELNGEAGHAKIHELIKKIRIAMFTTVAEDGSMNSRPMAIQDKPFDGTLWFLTRRTSDKVDEVVENQNVTLTFAEPKDAKFITLKGFANVNQSRAKIRELWNPMYKAWFPTGEEDPEIAVTRVQVLNGDFWEVSENRLIRFARYAAAAATGGSVSVGHAGHVEIS